MKTYMATPSTIERKWYVVDAADKTLGRLAAESQRCSAVNINRLLRPIWTRVIMSSSSTLTRSV